MVSDQPVPRVSVVAMEVKCICMTSDVFHEVVDGFRSEAFSFGFLHTFSHF